MGDYDPARTIEDAAYGAFLDPFHLVKPNHPWYANIESKLPRDHFGVAARLRGIFRSRVKRGDTVHLGLIGHMGTGKTTLVRQALAELREIGIMPVHVDALTTLDPSGFTFSDVVLVLVEAIVKAIVPDDAVHGPGVELEAGLLGDVRRWFAEEIISEEHSNALLGELQTQAEGGLSIPLIAKLLARVKGTLRSDNTYRTEIRRRAGRDPNELLRRVNVLVDAIHQNLAARKQQICVVFDNLEKISPRRSVEEAVLLRANDLRTLHCHAIYFLTPADQYAPQSVQASQVLTMVEVPALPIRYRDDGVDVVRPEARAAIELLLSRRLVLGAIFEDPTACIEAIARASGGRLRDVIDLTRYACEFAVFDGGKVALSHVSKAARKVGGSRVVVMRDGDWPRAVEIHRSKKVANRNEDSHMLLYALVLAYNGDPWWDVHPLMRPDERFEAAGKNDPA